jgi:hypothetical protein
MERPPGRPVADHVKGEPPVAVKVKLNGVPNVACTGSTWPDPAWSAGFVIASPETLMVNV